MKLNTRSVPFFLFSNLSLYKCCNVFHSQVKIALDWLRGERIEYRRFAAVLILKVIHHFNCNN